MAEGGATKAVSAIVNITCPGWASLTRPNLPDHGVEMRQIVTRYVGGLTTAAQYRFPAFYPTFEFCNFITGYAISGVKFRSSANNSIAGSDAYDNAVPPDGMTMTSDYSTERMPPSRQTIQVDTSCERTYKYYIIIETKLTTTTWADYIYTLSTRDCTSLGACGYPTDDRYTIRVHLGASNPSYVSAPASGFPSDSTGTMHKTLTLDAGSGGFATYLFDQFQCPPCTSTSTSTCGSSCGCLYYNLSSSSSAIVPVIQPNDYSLTGPMWAPPGSPCGQLSVRVPTDVLRNATASNQIWFYVYGAYNNNPSKPEADGRWAAFS